MSSSGRFVAFWSPRLDAHPGRHERHARRLRSRPSGRHDESRQHLQLRKPEQRPQHEAGGERRSAVHLPSIRSALSSRGHEPARGRVRPRPDRRDDREGEPRLGRRGIERASSMVSPRSARTAATWPSSSRATNLVAGDTNGDEDVFVRDRQTGHHRARQRRQRRRRRRTTTASTRRSPPTAATWLLDSEATNLVAGDTNGFRTSSSATARRQRPSASASDRRRPGERPQLRAPRSPPTAATSRSTAATNLVRRRHERGRGRLRPRPPERHDERVSVDSGGAEGNDASFEPSITADGRYVAFTRGTNLVAGDTNGVYERSSTTGRLARPTRASVGTGGAQGNGGSYEGYRRRSPPTAAPSRSSDRLEPGRGGHERRAGHLPPGSAEPNHEPAQRRERREEARGTCRARDPH